MASPVADEIGRLKQLHVRNTTLAAVSRSPYAKIEAFRERMGWTFSWDSSYGSNFNYDFHATLDDRVVPVLLHYRAPRRRGYLRRTGVAPILLGEFGAAASP